MYVRRITEEYSRNHCRRGKARSINYYECVCILALVTLNACHLSHVSTIIFTSHKRNDFRRKKKLPNKIKGVFTVQLLSEKSFHFTNKSARYHKFI